MIPKQKYYMCGKFAAWIEAEDDYKYTFRLSSVQSRDELSKRMGHLGFDVAKWHQPFNMHVNPISAYWHYLK